MDPFCSSRFINRSPKGLFSDNLQVLVIIEVPEQDLVQKITILYNSILDTDCDKIVCLG